MFVRGGGEDEKDGIENDEDVDEDVGGAEERIIRFGTESGYSWEVRV